MTRSRTNQLIRPGLALLLTVLLTGALISTGSAAAVEVDDPVGSILVVAPHPDDDVIIAAGITYKGSDVTITYLTNGDSVSEAEGTTRQGEAVTAQTEQLGRAEADLIFMGYPDGFLTNVWAQAAPGVFEHPTTTRSTTYATRGLDGTDWYDSRMGPGDQHADYNKEAMVADMVALIDARRPDHIFTTSQYDYTDDHATAYSIVDQALDQVVGTDPLYGAVLHETIVWHPDVTMHNIWVQDRDAQEDTFEDVVVKPTVSPTLASLGLTWANREQFVIPAAWQTPEGDDSNPKAQAVADHVTQGGLGGFIGRFVHRDEIFWADYRNYPILSISDATATEGGEVSFTVSRTGANNVAASVTATTSAGSAGSPQDYTFTSEMVTIDAGEASTVFVVPTNDDGASEPTENFTVILSSPSSNMSIADGTATGTINDNDSAAISLDLLDGLDLSEDGGTDSYRVALATQPTATVTLTLTPDAQLTADKSALVFTTTNWNTPQTVSVQAVDDSAAETDPHNGKVTHTASSTDVSYDTLSPVVATADIAENVAIAGPTTAATGSQLTFSADSGATTYSWTATRDGAPFASGSNPSLSFTPAVGGTYSVTVTESVGSSSPATASHTVKVLGDIAGTIFAADIIWLADEGITKGCNPPANDQFCPDSNVTRGQMAAFLVRALGLTDDGGGNKFTDDNGSIFEDAIAKLAAAGITQGCNPPDNTQFCPNDNVTRGQMAAFLVRALGLTDDGGGNKFTDDNGSIFEDAIAKLASAGITQGCNPPDNTQFCPNDNVTRGQMAAFLRRASALTGG